MRREQLTALGAGTVGGCQPVGLTTRDSEERTLIHKPEVGGGSSLEFAEEDIGIRSRARDKRADRSNKRRKEREGRASQQHEALGDIVGHTRIVHQHGHRHQTANRHHRLLEVEGGLGQQLHQVAETHALDESADDGTEENHQTRIRQPAELKGIADDGQFELRDQGIIQ